MSKLKNPLHSLGAIGRLSASLIFIKRRRHYIVEKTPTLKDSKTPAQLSWRPMFSKCVDLWHTLSPLEKQEWESLARCRHMTGYAWFLSQCLRPNPGIYLPLAGGTMTGVIDMGGNKITALLDPTANQEADTRLARNNAIAIHAAIAAAHHAAYTDAKADARIALHAAIAAAHHTPAVSTKEFFVPATSTIYGIFPSYKGDYACVTLDSSGHQALMTFKVPHDFITITNAEVIIIPTVNKVDHDFVIISDYAADGELYNTHSENASPRPNLTDDQIYAVDVSGILSALAADDYVGINIRNAETYDVIVLGIRFKYN